jgi:AraC family transcriptional regulator
MSTAIRVFQGKFGRVALLDMDRPLVTHAHSQCHVVFKVSGEDTSFSVRDKVYPLNDRTAVVVNTWEPHSSPPDHYPDAPRTRFLVLYIEPLWLMQIEKALVSVGSPGFFPHPCVEISKHIRDLADSLAMQMLYGEQLSEQHLESQLSNLMIAVIDEFSEWRNLKALQQSGLGQVHDFRIRRAISYMRQNLDTDLDIDKVAAEACLSRAHFFRLFQQSTNLTPNVYANVLRLEAAIHGLAQTQQSMISLSGNLGFSAQSQFTRFFQQHFGVAPSQYRKVVNVYSPDQSPVLASIRPK